MKFTRYLGTTAVTFFTALAIPVTAQEQLEQNQPHRYRLVDMGTFGGPNSYHSAPAPSVNKRGIAMGAADTLTPDPYSPNCFSADCLVTHAFKWQKGVLTDLGAFPQVNSSFPNWISDNGLIVGISENGLIDPLTGLPQFQAVLWKKDTTMIDLGNLGGDESQALAVNNKGQVIGTATNAVPDSFSVNCFYPMATQMRGFLWQNGEMQDLGTLGGKDTCAYLLNERGQISGFSYTDTAPNATTAVPTQVPFLWHDGKMVSLGTLGGTFGSPNYLNNRGQVVGFSNLAGDSFFHPFLWDDRKMSDLGTLGGSFGNATWINDAGKIVGWATPEGDQAIHAFVWMHGVMADLGTLGSDRCSGAEAINSSDQIVGFSGDCGAVEHPFLWQNGGPMVDLNTLVSSGSGLTVRGVSFINDSGEIYGEGVIPNGDHRAILLIPCNGDRNDGDHQCDEQAGNTNAATQGTPLSVGETSTRGISESLTPEMLQTLRTRSRGRYADAGAQRR